MNLLSIHTSGIILKSTSISAQSPTQTELTNNGLQTSGSRSVTRTYEVRESSLSSFLDAQLAEGSVSTKTLVSITAQTSGEGDIYNVSVTISNLEVSGSVPYYEQPFDTIFKHKSPNSESDDDSVTDKIPDGGTIIS